MPPKRATSSASSSAAASGSSGSSSSSSSSSSGSSSSSSGDDSDDDSSSEDSDSSASQTSKRSQRSGGARSRSASSASSSTSLSKKNAKKNKKAIAGAGAGVATRSASSASESDAAASKKKSGSSSKKSKKSAKSHSQTRKVAPKKSATAKPVPKPTALPKKQQALSENDSDSDFGDFSLSKLQAKKTNKAASSMASTASSSSASNTPNPVATPTTTHGVSGSAAASAQAKPAQPKPSQPKVTAKTAASTSAKSNKASSSATAAAAAASTGSGGGASKHKNIFSESDDSDKEVTINKKKLQSNKRSPSPPKLTPQKKSQAKAKPKAAASALASSSTAAAAAAPQKKKPPPPPPPKKSTRSSSVSSEASSDSSESSNLSRSSSESSDSEVKFQVASSSSVAAAASASSRKVASKKAAGKASGATGARKKAASSSSKKGALSTDSEGGKAIRPTTRQSRGGAPRRSKHITGRSTATPDSETETDAPGGGTGGTGNGETGNGRSLSPKKRKKTSVASSALSASSSFSYALNGTSGCELPPVRKKLDGILPIETRKCPVPGCDSSGHLGGRLERHFLQDACPIYHNIRNKDTKEFRQELNKRLKVREKALTVLDTKSPLQAPTSEQKKHAQKIKDARSTHRLSELPSVGVEEHSEEREVELTPFASEWDIKLFREAQALASEDLEGSLKGLPDTKTTRYIEMGRFEMEVWYQSQYPEEYTCLPRIFLCEFCLKYMKSAAVLRRHATKCVWKHPPGDEIYRKDKISVFEICGKRYKQYCQSLCLLAKFFLDHKTLYFEVEPFLFYVMTTADSEGCHFVGYFSKEKNSVLNYNVSCILTLPCYQRQGFGRLLIDFSYLLSRKEEKIGSPEKPLSDLGLITYRAYWKDIILEHISDYPEKELSIKEFSDVKGIAAYDIVSTLQYLGMIKYWKGLHVILKKEDLLEDYRRKIKNRPKGRKICEEALKWKKYEPSAKERKLAEKIKKSKEERQKRR